MDKAIFETAHLAALNDQQRAAVEAVNGPVLLLAVPGSGKTTVLITRLGYMTEVCGIAPEAILTMTYTVAATQEMRARFAARFGGELAARLEFRTINGVAARIIALYSRMYGRTPPELIRNESETSALRCKSCAVRPRLRRRSANGTSISASMSRRIRPRYSMKLSACWRRKAAISLWSATRTRAFTASAPPTPRRLWTLKRPIPAHRFC